MSRRARIGVLALQGAAREHRDALDHVGAEPVPVRQPAELASCDGLVIPGGESTTIRRLLVSSGLYEPLRERIVAGMPVLGTCAGMIVLADPAPDGAPPGFGVLDVTIERNGYGRQARSFEAPVVLKGLSGPQTVNGVFIRAPRIADVVTAQVIGTLSGGSNEGEPVAVRQGSIVACTFHPELAGDTTLHELVASMPAATMHA